MVDLLQKPEIGWEEDICVTLAQWLLILGAFVAYKTKSTSQK
jgi:hypothetical protein